MGTQLSILRVGRPTRRPSKLCWYGIELVWNRVSWYGIEPVWNRAGVSRYGIELTGMEYSRVSKYGLELTSME